MSEMLGAAMFGFALAFILASITLYGTRHREPPIGSQAQQYLDRRWRFVRRLQHRR